MKKRLHSVCIVKPKIGPESLAEKLIAMGNIEEVRLRDNYLGYMVKVRFMFKEPVNIERYIAKRLKNNVAAVAYVR